MPEILTDHEKTTLRDTLESYVDEYDLDHMDPDTLYAAVAKIVTTRRLDRPTINVNEYVIDGPSPAISFHCDTLDEFTAVINGLPRSIVWEPQTAGTTSDYLSAEHGGFRITVWPPRRLAEAPAPVRPNGAVLLLEQVRRG